MNYAGRGQHRTTALHYAVQPVQDPRTNADPRGLNPDGARQIAAVRALLRLGAGTLPIPPATII